MDFNSADGYSHINEEFHKAATDVAINTVSEITRESMDSLNKIHGAGYAEMHPQIWAACIISTASIYFAQTMSGVLSQIDASLFQAIATVENRYP